jgi:hypothetical protein
MNNPVNAAAPALIRREHGQEIAGSALDVEQRTALFVLDVVFLLDGEVLLSKQKLGSVEKERPKH